MSAPRGAAWAAAVAALLLAAPPRPAAADPADQPPQPHSDSWGAAVNDTALTAKVKIRLAGDKRLENSNLSVKTTNGVVTLSGTAPTAEASSAAEDLAQSVEGVKSVDNQISAPSRLEGAAADVSQVAHEAHRKVSDKWITTKIKTQLMADRSVQRDSDISVTTINGVVILSGTAASRDAFNHAQEVARNVKGVKSVDVSGLKVGAAAD
jgi:hyperosmotically inducible periplasmic protein